MLALMLPGGGRGSRGCGARQGSGSVCTALLYRRPLTSHPYRSHPPHPAPVRLFHISTARPINIGMGHCHLIFITLLILPNSNTYFLSYPRPILWLSNKTGVGLYLNELPPLTTSPSVIVVIREIQHLSSAVSIKLTIRTIEQILHSEFDSAMQLAACLNNL